MYIVFAIAWRDFKQIVLSPMFAMIGALCTTLWSYFFLRRLILFANRPFNPLTENPYGTNLHFGLVAHHIWDVNIMFMFVVPAITMKLISDEKRMNTFPLLLTLPISTMEIAIGKFLAGLGVTFLLIFLSLIYPLGTALLSPLELGLLLSSYMGLFLLCGLYVGLGLFASSVAQSSALSVIMGILLNLFLWSLAQGVLFTDDSFYLGLLNQVSVNSHFGQFLKGNFTLSSFVFFLTSIGLGVFLAQRSLETFRWRN